MMTTNRVEFPIAVNAISKLGAAAVLLSPAWKAAEVDHALVAHRRRCTPSPTAPPSTLLAERLGADAVTDLDDAATSLDLADGRRSPAADVGRRRRGDPRVQLRHHRAARRRCGTPTARSAPAPPTGCRRSASPPTTASRWPPRRRTSSACSTSWPPPRPAPPCGCTAASTSTRCCAASSPTASPSRWRWHRSRSAMAGPPEPRGARPLVAPLHHVGRHAGHRERRRGGHRAHRACAGSRPTAPASCR